MKRTRFEPDQYADLLIAEVDAEFFGKTGDFLHLGKHRDLITKHFADALEAAFRDGKTVGRHEEKTKERESRADVN
jgi:hypothetical protein